MGHSGWHFFFAVIEITADKLVIHRFSVPHSQYHPSWFSGMMTQSQSSMFSAWNLDSASIYDQPFSQVYYRAAQVDLLSLSQALLFNSIWYICLRKCILRYKASCQTLRGPEKWSRSQYSTPGRFMMENDNCVTDVDKRWTLMTTSFTQRNPPTPHHTAIILVIFYNSSTLSFQVIIYKMLLPIISLDYHMNPEKH